MSKKLDPTLNTSIVNIFAQNNQDPPLMITNFIFNGFLKLKNWDFASMLGLANMSGTWDFGTSCELNKLSSFEIESPIIK
jgi:hypothetical protein